MITNTELEHKGNLFPSKIISFKKDVDRLYFSTDNDVILQLTVVRDSVLRFRYTTTGIFDKDFSYAITKYLMSNTCQAIAFDKDGSAFKSQKKHRVNK